MKTDNSEDAGESEMLDAGKVEWNLDFDNRWQLLSSFGFGQEKDALGEERRIKLKGRCRRCWGGLIGKGILGEVPKALRCRVCGILFEGDEAKEEYDRMLKQDGVNSFQMAFGGPPEYRDDATFVSKIFPPIIRQDPGEFQQRANAAAQEGPKRGWLTRQEFPGGSGGLLLLQARTLMSAVERLPRESSVVRFWDIDINEDGSATLHVPTRELSEDSKTSEDELMKRLGSIMTIVMMSAFACELALKAIRLTRMDQARKTHDLWRLYRDLPEDSRARMEEDDPELDSVLRKARYTFDKWRYFEANLGDRSMSAMMDTGRAFALAKAARVLIDEAELMGLGFTVDIDATKKVTQIGDRQDTSITHELKITSKEAPPR